MDSISLVEPPAMRSSLPGPEFFDVERHPEITFRSTAVQLADDGRAHPSSSSTSPEAYDSGMRLPRFWKGANARDPAVSIADPRLEGWETVSTFEERATAVAWRDRLREMKVDAYCVADHPPDRFGRGDIYLVVPPEQWSRANEIVDNLDAE